MQQTERAELSTTLQKKSCRSLETLSPSLTVFNIPPLRQDVVTSPLTTVPSELFSDLY